jgi:hypothetical protein
MPKPKNQRDEFAEQYIAGIFADAAWSVYFLRKDKGFDFIVSKKTGAGPIIRPVEVKRPQIALGDSNVGSGS